MRRLVPVAFTFLLIAAVGFVATNAAWAKRPVPPPDPTCLCPPELDEPVLCPDGNIYPSPCVGSCHDQADCVPIVE